MAARRGSLGRGLDALIPAKTSSAERETGAGDPAGGVLEVEIGRIEPNPRQPRQRVDEVQLDGLVDSIREHGVIQPLVVSRVPAAPGSSPRFQLIAGERRWQAAKRAGLVRVPVVVREVTPRASLELALVENVQRADLNPLEEAAAYHQLVEEFGLTQEEVARRVGKSRVAIANTLRLLQLPAAVQQDLIDGRLTEGHARAILGLRDREAQRRVAQEAIDHGLSVRQTEALVRRALAAPARAARACPPDVVELEARFRELLGTKVALNRSRRGGRLVIYYFDDEQLQSIYERLDATQ